MSECAREGCGHKRKRHQWVMDRRDICSEKGCDCSGFLPPRPVPEDPMPLLCRRCGIRPAFDMTGLQCVECTQLFGQLDDPASVPAPHADAEADPRDDPEVRAAWDEWSRNTPESFWDVAVWPRREPGGIEPSIIGGVSLDVANRYEIFAHAYLRGRGDRG